MVAMYPLASYGGGKVDLALTGQAEAVRET